MQHHQPEGLQFLVGFGLGVAVLIDTLAQLDEGLVGFIHQLRVCSLEFSAHIVGGALAEGTRSRTTFQAYEHKRHEEASDEHARNHGGNVAAEVTKDEVVRRPELVGIG